VISRRLAFVLDVCWFNRGKVGHTAPTETEYVAPDAALLVVVVEANAEPSKAVDAHSSATALENIVMLRCREAISYVLACKEERTLAWLMKDNISGMLEVSKPKYY
jgi:hypothetical protein